MSSNNHPKSPDKNGPDNDPAKKPQAAVSSPAKADAPISVIKFILASELATWPVYPFAELFDMMPQADLKRLGDSLAVRQANSVIVWRGIILDGRNRIAAGALKDLVLRVEILDELADEDIEEVILALNNQRRSDKKSTVVKMAVDYYKIRKGTDGRLSVTEVAKKFGVSRRTMFNYMKRERQAQEHPKPRKAFDRVAPNLHIVAVAISHMGILKNSPTGRSKHKRYRAEFHETASEMMSQPEMQHLWDSLYRNDKWQDGRDDELIDFLAM